MQQKLSVTELYDKAREIRINILKMLLNAQSGHSAGSLGMADIFAAFYFNVLNHDPNNPLWEERDRLILSCGHIVPVRYVAMALSGYFPISDLENLRSLGSNLQGHPERLKMPSLESTSGPLGSGLSQAAGYAWAAKKDEKKYNIYCVCSDGEHQEGNHWEAVMFAAKYKLSNLTVVVDRNNIQIDGFTEEIMPLENLKNKYEAFNWKVIEIDGHNIDEFISAVNYANSIHDYPVCIIAHTIPGKGVEFMENLPEWHGKAPKLGETIEAISELRSLNGNIDY